jgi:two-component system response regulator PilR (NtrC family)
MREIFSTITRLGDCRATVLITGESGTGKELVAKAIHFSSNRRARPFISVNCGAIPQELIESELFGHVKGAFTGALSAKQGLFEVAHGGTLFLDEVSELPLHLQVKLLRVLEDPEVRPVGGVKPVRVDVRIVAATNRNLAEAMERGVFRTDLYYRLNVITLSLPALRERREDIPLLVEHFLEKFAAAAAAPPKTISPEALLILEAHVWPGNVRELENVIERAVILETGPVIGVESLPELIRAKPQEVTRVELPPEGIDLDVVMEGIEKDLLTQALRRAHGVQTRAAQMLQTSFRSFRYRLQKYGLEREQ